MSNCKERFETVPYPFCIMKKSLLFYLTIIFFAILWGIGQYPSFFFLRYFGLIPFIFIVLKRKHYIIETLIFGTIAYLFNFYWLFITFKESGKLPEIISSLIVLALCAYYGLQYPIIALIFKKITQFNKKLFYAFPLIFVTIDFLYPKLFTHSIADSQIGFYSFIQFIDITGMSGLIIIIMLLNVGFYKLLEKLILKTKLRVFDFIFLIPFVIAVGYGIVRVDYLAKKEKSLDTTYAAMIQGNITGKQKMDRSYLVVNLERYNKLTKEASEKYKPDFIIWPESVFNRGYDGTDESLKTLLFDNYPPLIMGITFWKSRGKSFSLSNSAFLIKDRKVASRYDKRHLLIFGEYIPFEKTLPFLRYLTPLNYSMTPGITSSIFNINDKVKACMSICFEDIFPDEIRQKVNEGSNLMINMTNDSWYGKGLGPLHHSILARLRSIENRRSLYRCTATGLTTANDFTGKLIVQGAMWDAEIVTAKLPLYEGRTIYSYIGELVSYLSIMITVLLMLFVLIKKYTARKIIRPLRKE